MSYPRPWEQCPEVWKTESSFWVFVRGVLRKGWSKHPVKLGFINTYRKRIVNPVEKNRVRFPTCWGMTCSICNIDTAQKDIEIDHIGEGSSFTGLHDAEKYLAHLFLVDYNSLRPVCKPCHKIENQRQKMGVSFEEAAREKAVIAICKDESTGDIIQFILDYSWIKEYDVGNAANRREAIRDIFKNMEDLYEV